MTEYYIYSNNFTIQDRQTKKGTVYDVVFRVITLDGVEKQKKLSGFKTKALAKQAHAQFVTEKCEVTRVRPKKEESDVKNEITVAEAIQKYIAYLLSHNENKESVIYDKQNIFRLFVVPHIGDIKIKDLSKSVLEEWQDKVIEMRNRHTGKPYSTKYFIKIRGYLNSLLSWAEDRYEYKNLLPKVKRPAKRASEHKIKFWSPETFEKFISVVDEPTYHCLFTMMFYTGRRKGELFALSPDDIHTDTIVWEKSLTRKVLKGQLDEPYAITSTKEEKVQKLPICKRVRDEIKKYGGNTPFFFGGDRPLPENTVTRVFQRYCQKAGVEIIRIHDLRHSFASMLLANGENYKVIADLLGDTVEQVMKTYCHICDKDLENALTRIDNLESKCYQDVTKK